MKFNEWNVIQENSLFEELIDLAPNGIISKLGADEVNLYYAITYGGRELIEPLERINTRVVAKMIHGIHSDKWEKLSEMYSNEFEIGFDSSTSTETLTIDTSNKDVSTNNTQQVSAYNDDELSNVSGEMDSLNEKGERENTTTITTTNKNLKSFDIQRNMLENRNSISRIICDDIASIVSLAVY